MMAAIMNLTANISIQPWSFLVMPDQHVFTPFSYSLGVPETEDIWNESANVLNIIQSGYGGDLVMMPGDSASYGTFTNKQIARKLGYSLFDQHSIEDAIYEAGTNCYRAIRDLFQLAGYETILSCMGDHEIGGNKGFRTSGQNSKLSTVPTYRKAFGDAFNKNEDGAFLFSQPIGGVPSRPMGTIYEDTSYAYVHKNALFITVDVFKQLADNFMDRIKGLGGEGAITCDVSDDHLLWFENVLAEAKKDSGIRHIFVQGHVPIVQPVRKVKCSGQFFDRGDESPFWKVMSKYGVDIYFAGEVHSNTASRSANVVQIVTRGRSLSDFLNIKITDTSIDITLLNEIGEKPRWNGKYEEYGKLTIDKNTQGQATVLSSGELKLIDKESALLHFDFEETYPLGHRQVLGLIGEHELMKKNMMIRNVNCSQSMLNSGSFGAQYDAQIGNIDLVNGRIENSLAASFGTDSRFAIYGVGPFGGGEIMSFSLWIKTTQTSKMILVHYGNVYGADVRSVTSGKDQMTLILSDGIPELYIKHNRKLVSQTNSIADGRWHLVSVSMPSRSCRLSEIEIFVDEKAVKTERRGKDTNTFQLTHGRIAIGGFGSTTEVYEEIFSDWNPYMGLIDDFSLWPMPLKQREAFKRNTEYECMKLGGDKNNSYHMNTHITSKNKCRTKCKNDDDCFGFEFSAGSCIHFNTEPVLGSVKENSECSMKLILQSPSPTYTSDPPTLQPSIKVSNLPLSNRSVVPSTLPIAPSSPSPSPTPASFQRHVGYKCEQIDNDNSYQINEHLKSKNKCRAKCKHDHACLGFEFSSIAHACIHFGVEPTLGVPAEKSECSMKIVPYLSLKSKHPSSAPSESEIAKSSIDESTLTMPPTKSPSSFVELSVQNRFERSSASAKDVKANTIINFVFSVSVLLYNCLFW